MFSGIFHFVVIPHPLSVITSSSSSSLISILIGIGVTLRHLKIDRLISLIQWEILNCN